SPPHPIVSGRWTFGRRSGGFGRHLLDLRPKMECGWTEGDHTGMTREARSERSDREVGGLLPSPEPVVLIDAQGEAHPHDTYELASDEALVAAHAGMVTARRVN